MNRRGMVLLLVISAASFARMYFLNSSPISDVGADPLVYHQIAVNLVEGRGFSQSPAPPYRPALLRTPGYPVFLALVYRLFGVGNFEAVRVMHILLMIGAGLSLYFSIWILLEDKAAALAGLVLFSAYSFGVMDRGIYGYLMTENLSIALVNAAFLCVSLCYKRPRPLPFASAGVLFGMAALTRPTNLYFTVVAAAVFAWLRLRPRDIALFCASASLLIAPWIWRNHRVFSRWTFSFPTLGLQLMQGLPDNPDWNFYSTFDPDKAAPGEARSGIALTPVELERVRPLLAAEERMYNFGGDGGPEMEEPDSQLRKFGFEVIRRSPGTALRRVFYRILGLWSLADLANLLNGLAPPLTLKTALKIAVKLGLGALALVGLLAIADRGARVLILSFPVYNTAVYSIVGLAKTRYSFPARSFLFILLAAGCLELARRGRAAGRASL